MISDDRKLNWPLQFPFKDSNLLPGIRIDDQWRICFEWPDGQKGPSNGEIVDYH